MIAVERLSWRRVRSDRLMLRRAMLTALVLLSVLAIARTVVWPPAVRTIERVADRAVDPQADALAQTFAALFLTVDTAHPDIRTAALKPFGEERSWELSGMPAETVKRSVLATQVAQVAPRGDGSRIVVVQAQLSTGVVTYLAVRTERNDAGELQIVGSPAIVGAPPVAAAAPGPKTAVVSVGDPQINEVVERGMRNLLALRLNDVRADLTPTARVVPPEQSLRLDTLEELVWTQEGESVLARLAVTDGDGLQLRLDYELDLTQTTEGRWQIAAVHVAS